MQRLGQGTGVAHYLTLVLAEALGHGFLEGNRFGCDDVHEGTGLDSREDGAVDGIGEMALAHDEGPAGAAQGLVRGGGDHIGVGYGAGVLARGDESDNVGDVGH